MSQWRVKSSTLLVLGCLTCVMLLIVVLPDVDLPDTAFHRGSAPAIVHARVNSAPTAVDFVSPVRLPESEETSLQAESTAPVDDPTPNFRHILLHSLRC